MAVADAAQTVPTSLLVIQVVTACVAVAGVLVALFRESLFLWLRRPQFELAATGQPPDSNKALMRTRDGQEIPAYFLRFWVKNVGQSTATSIQVFATELQREASPGRLEADTHFLPM